MVSVAVCGCVPQGSGDIGITIPLKSEYRISNTEHRMSKGGEDGASSAASALRRSIFDIRCSIFAIQVCSERE